MGGPIPAWLSRLLRGTCVLQKKKEEEMISMGQLAFYGQLTLVDFSENMSLRFLDTEVMH